MFWRALAIRLTAPAVGVALAVVILPQVIDLVGFGSLDRIRLLGERVDQLAASGDDAGATLLVGNSVVVEGLDAATVRAAADSKTPVRNYGLDGTSLAETEAILPRLLATQPAHVVLVVMPTHLVEVDRNAPNIDRIYDYSGLTTSANNPSTRWDTLPKLRTAPLMSLDHHLRQTLARGRRVGAEGDWSSPYRLTADLPPVARQRNLELVESLLKNGSAERRLRELGRIERMRIACEQAGSKLIVCRSPVHPLLRPLAGSLDKADIDLATSLDDEQFADAVHPNAAGRDRFSRSLGRALYSLSRSAATVAQAEPIR